MSTAAQLLCSAVASSSCDMKRCSSLLADSLSKRGSPDLRVCVCAGLHPCTHWLFRVLLLLTPGLTFALLGQVHSRLPDLPGHRALAAGPCKRQQGRHAAPNGRLLHLGALCSMQICQRGTQQGLSCLPVLPDHRSGGDHALCVGRQPLCSRLGR